MPGTYLGFDGRYLGAGSVAIHAGTSFRRSSAISSNVRPSPSSVALPPVTALPPGNYHVNVLWIDFESVTDALGDFRGGQGRTRSEERLVDRLPALSVI